MKKRLHGIIAKTYSHENSDCLLDIYEANGIVHIYFVDLERDIFYHWELGKRVKVKTGSPFWDQPSERTDNPTEVKGLYAGEYYGDFGTCKLQVFSRDWGTLLTSSDSDSDTVYRWTIDELGELVSFRIGDLDEVKG
jgi:hypothetical protein